ncbi:hypothetical protein SAMN05216559_0137 [Halomicrobium zhouii]|uniref:Uncharacterized protein n=1 Tax=Halomicrobium zhouii TaxID=767519 RepID=A0A1I6K3N1_9EURY|nr:hypothetical protein SAMN05216559_0137 [Halomicrobium zhouii]
MGFIDYLLHLGIDAVLVILGIFSLFTAASFFYQRNTIMAIVLLGIAGILFLFVRYRNVHSDPGY